MTTSDDARPAGRKPIRKPRTFNDIRAEYEVAREAKRAAEQAEWDAKTPAQQVVALFKAMAEDDAKAEREAQIHERVQRLNAATEALLALALQIEQASLDETDDSDIEIEQDCAD